MIVININLDPRTHDVFCGHHLCGIWIDRWRISSNIVSFLLLTKIPAVNNLNK